MTKITLDPRLATLADLVQSGHVTADIGTDHGYLLTALLQSGKIPFGYACDINQGPLDSAKETLIAHGQRDRAELCLTDGLHGLEKEPISQFLLAGMGGELIARILKEGAWAHQKENVFILQPMTREYQLRQQLYKMGFQLIEERAVQSGRHAYVCMKAEYTGNPQEIDWHFAWSGLLWDQNSTDSNAYLAAAFRRLKNKQPAYRENSEYINVLSLWEERFPC